MSSIHLASLLVSSTHYIKVNNGKATNIDADADAHADADVGGVDVDIADIDRDNHSSMGMMICTSMNYNNINNNKIYKDNKADDPCLIPCGLFQGFHDPPGYSITIVSHISLH